MGTDMGPATGATSGTAAAVASGATSTGTEALSGPVIGLTMDTKAPPDGLLSIAATAPRGAVDVALVGSSGVACCGEFALGGERAEEEDEASDEVDTMDESRAALWLLLGRLSLTSSSTPLVDALSLSSLLSSLLLLPLPLLLLWLR